MREGKDSLTTRQDLARIKSKALRAKVWFRALTKVERSIVDLTIKCVETIRSSVLAGTISVIIDKILQSFEEGFIAKAEKVGSEIAEALCAFAEKWGNKTCSSWKCDKCFIRFLGVNALGT